MLEVVRELRATKKAHKKAIEKQKYAFQIELKKRIEKFHQVELHSRKLESKINTLKGQKQTPKPHPTQNILARQNAPIILSSIKLLKRKKQTLRWLPWACLKTPWRMLGQKLLKVIKDEKPLYKLHQKLSQKKEW